MKHKNGQNNGLKAAAKYLCYKVYYPLVYFIYSRRPIKESLILFADNCNRAIPDNFLPMIKIFKDNGYHCVVLSRATFTKKTTKIGRGIGKFCFYTAMIQKVARCKVLFLTDYIPPVDVIRMRKETQVVQLWHACGLGKKWGYAIENENWGTSRKVKELYPMYKAQTLACCSSHDPEILKAYQHAFGCAGGVVQALGIPRTDHYFDPVYCQAVRDRVRESCQGIGERKIILFAPTFRGNSLEKSYYEYPFDMNRLEEAFGKQYVFLIKLHPMIARKSGKALEKEAFSYDITNKITAEEAICAADILITDYSSILFEFLLFEKPIISYVPDLEQYESERGLFLPYKEMAPGPYITTQEELIQKLKTVMEWFDIDQTRRYKDRFMSACDGHSTERIFSAVIDDK